MTSFQNAFAAASFAFVAAVAQQAVAKEAINTLGSDHNVAISGLDTVAFFTEHKPVQGKETFAYEWKGARWRTASGRPSTRRRRSPCPAPACVR